MDRTLPGMSSVARRVGVALRTIGLIVAACAASPFGAQAEAPAPGQVIGYANADRSGPSQAWDLPLDKPYLYVPFIGEELGGRVALVETGPEVGAILFQQPYFASRDIGCHPDMGTDARPDLRWLGATARLVPAPPGQPGVPGDSGGYGSLILYRTDLGPPPGLLLLDRRPTVGMRCANPAHKTVYNRLFVPVAEAPQTARCFDLRGDYPAGGPKPTALDFVRSDRLILLMPGDANDRYGRIQHDVTVTLFDGLACRGRSVSFASRAQLGRDIRLDQYEFRDRARSIRLVYDGGNAEPFLLRTPMPEPPAPAVVQTPAPAPQAPPAPVAATAPKALTAAEPMTDPTVASRAEPAPAPAGDAASTPPPAKVPTATPRAVQQALPKLSPVLPGALGEPVTAAVGLRRFEYPTHDIYRLNACLHWRSDCGAPAAAAWCKTQGFTRVVDWTLDEGIGANFPSVVIGEDRVCAEEWCSGFRAITCGR